MTPGLRSQAMACRATSPRTSAFASSAMSQSARARPMPKRASSQSWPRRCPDPICPPFRPEAPHPTRCASRSTTRIPASARCSAAESPV